MPVNQAMFTKEDLAQIQNRGSDLAVVEKQVENFQTGFPFLEVIKAATVGDGIIRLNQDDIDQAISHYRAQLSKLKVVKFVPASGAASRMFKALFAFMDEFDGSQTPEGALADFFSRIQDFAFYQDLNAALGNEIDSLIAQKEYGKILKRLLTSEGLGYGELPKGLLQFHQYDDHSRTPAEEHLVEAANYAAEGGSTAFLHFTVSPEHQSKFQSLMDDKLAHYEALFGVKLEVSFSVQKPSTDTIAVDMDNNPFREKDGTILFRPGGHGALIENLNDLEADLVFIKNIDNVVPDRIKGDTYTYKQALAGVLLQYQEKLFGYLQNLDSNPTLGLIEDIENFLKNTLCVVPVDEYAGMDKDGKVAYLKGILNRPIRVCGMVKNEGEPGGGPFWVKNSNGTVSLQIAESAQIDTDDEGQKAIMQNATHFNPVDLVCGMTDYQGNKFDLLQYRDPATGFIAYKSKSGRELKAQELPGLWNGAMANWNTLFVEVPIITFNPVKTVNDLLRPNHQR